MNTRFSVLLPRLRENRSVPSQILEAVEEEWKHHALRGTLDSVPHLQQARKTLLLSGLAGPLMEHNARLKHDLSHFLSERRLLALLSLSALSEKTWMDDSFFEALTPCLTDRNSAVREAARNLYAQSSSQDTKPERVVTLMLASLKDNPTPSRSAFKLLLELRFHRHVSQSRLDNQLDQLARLNGQIRYLLERERQEPGEPFALPVTTASVGTPHPLKMQENFLLLNHSDPIRRKNAARCLAVTSQSGYRLFRQGKYFVVKTLQELIS